MKEAVTKVIDMLTQEDFQKLLERYKCIAAGGDYLEGGLEFHVCTQHYKVRFKGKVEQSREWSSALPYTLV